MALQDWTKRQKSALNGGGADTPDVPEGPSPHLPTGPKKDFSLREGETISIKIPGGGGGGAGRRKVLPTTTTAPLTGGFLPPPPSKKR